MPSDSKTTDPRPAATEAANDIIESIAWFRCEHDSRASISDDDRQFASWLVEWLDGAGFQIIPTAAAPPSGQVCVEWALLAGAAYLIRFGSEQSELRDTTLATLEALVEPYRVQFSSADLGNGADR